jgi:hypothetical protein
MKRMVLIGSLALVIALFLGMSNVYAQQQSTQQPQAVGWYCPMMGHGTTAGGWYCPMMNRASSTGQSGWHCPWMGGGNSAGHRMMGCMMGSGGQAPPATQN